MSRRAVAVASTMVLLALLAFSTVAIQAQDGALEILVTRSNYYEAPVGQSIVLHGRWGACSTGLVRNYIHAGQSTVFLDEELLLLPEEIDLLWEPITEYGPWEWCVSGDTAYWAHWYYELPFALSPGTHWIVTTLTIDHPLHDGADYDGDGQPDLLPADWSVTPENELYIYLP